LKATSREPTFPGPTKKKSPVTKKNVTDGHKLSQLAGDMSRNYAKEVWRQRLDFQLSGQIPHLTLKHRIKFIGRRLKILEIAACQSVNTKVLTRSATRLGHSQRKGLNPVPYGAIAYITGNSVIGGHCWWIKRATALRKLNGSQATIPA
jgi:hypothetical protein